MYTPVACSACGQPFQVLQTTLGQPTVCPWCQATVVALPIAGTVVPSPAATVPGVPSATAQEPLSLDDEPAPQPQPQSSRRRRWWIAFTLVATVLVMVATFAVVRYKQGHALNNEWERFTAPDGSYQLDLPGRAQEGLSNEDLGSYYFAEGWYSGITAWVGWRELTAAERDVTGTAEAWQQFLKPFEAEQLRLKLRFNGDVVRNATRFDPQLTHEVRLTTPRGQVVERIIVSPQPARPRIYFVGLAGKNLDPDSPVATRFFDSFRITE